MFSIFEIFNARLASELKKILYMTEFFSMQTFNMGVLKNAEFDADFKYFKMYWQEIYLRGDEGTTSFYLLFLLAIVFGH
jgi:hypothetical protein